MPITPPHKDELNLLKRKASALSGQSSPGHSAPFLSWLRGVIQQELEAEHRDKVYKEAQIQDATHRSDPNLLRWSDDKTAYIKEELAA